MPVFSEMAFTRSAFLMIYRVDFEWIKYRKWDKPKTEVQSSDFFWQKQGFFGKTSFDPKEIRVSRSLFTTYLKNNATSVVFFNSPNIYWFFLQNTDFLRSHPIFAR
jgi:hypothetical protein